MAFFTIVAKKNPSKPDESPRYYAMQRTIGTLTEDQLADKVSRHTGTSRGIIKAVLTDIIDEVMDNVALGYNVRLGELGIFSVGVKTATPTDKPEDFSEANIDFSTMHLRLTKMFKEKIKANVKMTPFKTVIGEDNPKNIVLEEADEDVA